MGETRRKLLHLLIEFVSEEQMCNGDGELVNLLIEVISKCQMSELRRKSIDLLIERSPER